MFASCSGQSLALLKTMQTIFDFQRPCNCSAFPLAPCPAPPTTLFFAKRFWFCLRVVSYVLATLWGKCGGQLCEWMSLAYASIFTTCVCWRALGKLLLRSCLLGVCLAVFFVLWWGGKPVEKPFPCKALCSKWFCLGMKGASQPHPHRSQSNSSAFPECGAHEGRLA